MSREERAKQIAELRKRGMWPAQIARYLGLSSSYVYELIHDPTGVKSAARRDSYRGTCESCGRKTFGGDGPAKAPKLCRKCANIKQSEERHWVADLVLERIREWAQRFGEPPVATDWLRGREHRTELMDEVDEDGFAYWPHPSILMREFGSWANAIEAAGFKRPAVGGHRSDFDHQSIVALCRQGLSDSEVARRMNCSRKTVQQHRLKAGISRGPSRRTFDYDEMNRLHAAGWSRRKIGAHLGVSHNTIHSALARQAKT